MFIDEGVVQIDIWKLKKKISKSDLSKALGNVYSPLIKSSQVEIISNGKIFPTDFPLELPEDSFEILLDSRKIIKGWLSILQSGNKLRGGIRCYCFGRLIAENEFFKQKNPSYKESIDRLIGEIYIDIEEIPLLINKSDFDRGSAVWKEIQDKMYVKMEPYIQLLLEEKDRDVPTDKEQKIAQEAGDFWAEFLRFRQNEQKGGAMPGLPLYFGQKPPQQTASLIVESKDDLHGQEKTNKKEKYEPATPPPVGSIGKRRRTGGFPRPVLHPLPETVRYELSEEGDTKVIKINTSFPAYKIRKSQLRLYIWETLALEYAKPEDSDTQTVGEYIEEMNDILYDLSFFIRKRNMRISN